MKQIEFINDLNKYIMLTWLKLNFSYNNIRV